MRGLFLEYSRILNCDIRIRHVVWLAILLPLTTACVILIVIIHDSRSMSNLRNKCPRYNYTDNQHKQFIYLLQSDQPNIDPTCRLLRNSNRDILWLSYDVGAQQVDGVTVIVEPSSWTVGRNLLLEEALTMVNQTAGQGYLYYIFLDEDMLKAVVGEDPWAIFEDFLLHQEPSVGYLPFSDPEAAMHVNTDVKYTQGLFKPGANIQAFHRRTVGTLIPYDSSLDDQSIFFSSYTGDMMVAALYASSSVGFNKISFDYSKISFKAHSEQFKRVINYSTVKRYIYRLFLKSDQLKALDVINCYDLNHHMWCDYRSCGRKSVVASITDSWISENLNIKAHAHGSFLLNWRKSHRDVVETLHKNSPDYVEDFALGECT